MVRGTKWKYTVLTSAFCDVCATLWSASEVAVSGTVHAGSRVDRVHAWVTGMTRR